MDPGNVLKTAALTFFSGMFWSVSSFPTRYKNTNKKIIIHKFSGQILWPAEVSKQKIKPGGSRSLTHPKEIFQMDVLFELTVQEVAFFERSHCGNSS